jgi:pimeloyl-ACP methyl ester carboxylesterase
MLHEAATRLNLRVITFDRPGYGASSFDPCHSLQSWAHSLHGVTQHLGIEKFSILGISGGAPFAAACARYLPPERVLGLGLVCPMGPLNHTGGMSMVNKLMLRSAWHWPWLCHVLWTQAAKRMSADEQCMVRVWQCESSHRVVFWRF